MYHLNPHVGKGLTADLTGDPAWNDYAWVCDSNAEVAKLLAHCPKHQSAPLVQVADFPGLPSGTRLSLKDETARMGLGSFKALGAAFVIAQDAARADAFVPWEQRLVGKTYVAASAGNHGLSVAAGANIFGAQAVIVLSQTVPPSFAARLESMGAEVVIYGQDYAASMDHAVELAEKRNGLLLSDSSWPGYLEPAWKVMQGYSQLAAETVEQIPTPPDTILLQAGVGGLAAACAAVFRRAWGEAPQIIVVEPEAAPALQRSIQERRVVFADGPVSNMGRLDCKEPSLLALKSLARDANAFVTISDEQAANMVKLLAAETGIQSSPSGIGALAAAFLPDVKVGKHLLCIVSEGAD